MTTLDPCNCDASKAWEARSIRAEALLTRHEADLALTKNMLREVETKIAGLMDVLAFDEVAAKPVARLDEAAFIQRITELAQGAPFTPEELLQFPWAEFVPRIAELLRSSSTVADVV